MQSIPQPTIVDELRRLQERAGPEVDLPAFLEAQGGAHSEDDIADLIEADGRARLERGLATDLGRYLSAFPAIGSSAQCLDAAIDMALRQLSRSDRPSPEAVETLVGRYPEFADAIREAAQLNLALWSTSALAGRAPEVAEPILRVPCDLGPIEPDGRARYVARELLGSGISGDVYQAVDRRLSEPDHDALVAIKVLRGGNDERGTMNDGPHGSSPIVPRSHSLPPGFFDEATKARRVTHPAVVRIEDCGLDPSGLAYLVYEYLPGGDLQQLLDGRAELLPVREAASFVARLARGVHAAHGAGLIHCDLKPSNVLLDAEGQPKVADFGVALRVPSAECRVPSAGCAVPPVTGDSALSTRHSALPVGNLAFMAPEQYRMEAGAVSTSADIYALGGLLYYLLTRRAPNGSTFAEIDRAHDPRRGRVSPPSAREVRPEVDADLDAIGRRALACDAAERHSSAAALADDLDRWLDHRPIPWRNPSAARVMRLWGRRRPAIAALSVLLLTAVVAGAVIGGRLFWLAAQRKIENARLAADAAVKKKEAVEARAEATARARAQRIMRDTIGSLRDAFNPRTAAEVDASILAESYLMEWLFGPAMLSDPVRMTELWSRRIEVARGIVADAADDIPGHPGASLRSLLWESTLGLWLVLDGDPAEAERALIPSRDKWRALLPAEDPWLARLDGLIAAAGARRHLAMPATAFESAEARLADLRSLVDDLVGHERILAAQPPSIIHMTILLTLRDLWSPEALDDAGRVAELERRLQAYGSLAAARLAVRRGKQ